MLTWVFTFKVPAGRYRYINMKIYIYKNENEFKGYSFI
jgi:hypothetical protein